MNFKAILSLMGLVCLLLTSCSKEEITPLNSSIESVSTSNIVHGEKSDGGDDDTVNNPNVIFTLSDGAGNGLGDYMIRMARRNFGNNNSNANGSSNNITDEYTAEGGIASFLDMQRGFYRVTIFNNEDELVHVQRLRVRQDRYIAITIE